MANWKPDNASGFVLQAGPATNIVGRVRRDKETDRSAIGWRAYAMGERHLEDAGYFRTLKAAMQHVMVLHKLEN